MSAEGYNKLPLLILLITEQLKLFSSPSLKTKRSFILHISVFVDCLTPIATNIHVITKILSIETILSCSITVTKIEKQLEEVVGSF